MRSLGGLVLLSGIGVAVFVYLPAPVDRGASDDELRRAAAAPDVQLPPSRFTAAALGRLLTLDRARYCACPCRHH
jgi:hypothetical protein